MVKYNTLLLSVAAFLVGLTLTLFLIIAELKFMHSLMFNCTPYNCSYREVDVKGMLYCNISVYNISVCQTRGLCPENSNGVCYDGYHNETQVNFCPEFTKCEKGNFRSNIVLCVIFGLLILIFVVISVWILVKSLNEDIKIKCEWKYRIRFDWLWPMVFCEMKEGEYIEIKN